MMKIKLLIALDDGVYAKLLSDNISEYHSDTVDVCLCNSPEGLKELLKSRRFNVALVDAAMIGYIDMKSIHLPLLLWSETEANSVTAANPDVKNNIGRINKYQRISSIVSAVLEQYARVSTGRDNFETKHTCITAIWSPAGGTGKTSVAIAYALSRVTGDKEVFYLNIENFSSIPCFFNENGKSISTVFEMLENSDGDIKMLIKGISGRDKGITFLSGPDNYDDINILSCENVHELITFCAQLADELVIDMSCGCDSRTRKVFDLAGKILLVTDPSGCTGVKLAQFLSQNNVFETIKEKTVIVANKGAILNGPYAESIISLPLMQTADISSLNNSLAEYFIDV